MERGDCERELQLLPLHSATRFPPWAAANAKAPPDSPDHPHLDLSLSIGAVPVLAKPCSHEEGTKSIQALKRQAAEQIRLAAAEKAYAERVRELTRREMEQAEKEFARARLLWERAREEVDKVERMKELATRIPGSTCTEVTCQACRQRFRP